MLALLLLVVLAAIGGVLWFMREAMRNERMAVREKLAEAYRGHLTLVQTQAGERWDRWRERLDGITSAPLRFERAVREGWADSVVCFDETGAPVYPQAARPPGAGAAKVAAALQAELRALVQAGKTENAIQFVLERFAAPEAAAALDEQGRLAAANAELLALELLGGHEDPRFEQIIARLRRRALDYTAATLPTAQRRFVMRELQRLDPRQEFPTLAAEDLAARFLESQPPYPADPNLRRTELPGVWSAGSRDGRTLAILADATLRTKLRDAIHDPTLPAGVSLTALAPGEDDTAPSALVTMPLGPAFPGWRISLLLDDRTLFDTEAAKRVRLHVVVAGIVIAAMSVLTLLIARGFGRHVALARMKNDLVATVSHELKTPLTAMRALVETLLDADHFDEKTTREYLQLLATENARLSRLIENFLTFSRLERNKFSFEFRPVQPRQVVEGAVAAFGERATATGCTLECCVADNLPPIRGDLDALVTTVLNLLDNAWKYSGEEKHIALRADARNGHVRFAVEDHGIGLAPWDRERIFDRFHQVDQRLARVGGGCGLGLSIVQAIVQAHAGRIEVASEPSRGSTFTIDIPAAA
jgi:signal transduction histidine kinase